MDEPKPWMTEVDMLMAADQCETEGNHEMAACIRSRAPFLNEVTRCWRCGIRIHSMMEWVKWPACQEHSNLIPPEIAAAMFGKEN